MQANSLTRRNVLSVLAAMPAGFILSAAAADKPAAADAAPEQEISHTAVAIHQELLFHASRARVYRTLTDGPAFDRVVRLSQARKSGMIAARSAPSRISARVGGAFSLFGGYISGMQVELVPDERIVQVWRTGSWDPGDYSIARYRLADQGPSTLLMFDHEGFPAGDAQHLAEGWHSNYWQPLAQALSGANG